MFEDVLARVQDFLAEQFGYEVCRWQIVAACVLIVIVLSIAGFAYARDTRSTNKKSVRIATRIETLRRKTKQREKETPQTCVYVCGAVARPGVYSLKGKSRVVDAVNACGGFAADADLNSINLAKIIIDGERIWIPRVGEANNNRIVTPANSDPSGPEKVNINTASADDLDSLPGIGKILAENIIRYRDEHGSFQSTDQLLEVDGIGPKKFADIKDKITL